VKAVSLLRSQTQFSRNFPACKSREKERDKIVVSRMETHL